MRRSGSHYWARKEGLIRRRRWEKMGLLGFDKHGTLRATVAGILFCSHSPEEWLPNACITANHYRVPIGLPANSTPR